MYVKGAPLFPFGHGLSYTTFAYEHLKISPASIKADGSVEVSIDVTNTGRMAGDEVVQLYVRDIESSVTRPAKELRGFRRVSLQPGEKHTITFTVPAEKLAFWDENSHAFTVEPGAFEILIGASSDDIRPRHVRRLRVTMTTARDRGLGNIASSNGPVDRLVPLEVDLGSCRRPHRRQFSLRRTTGKDPRR